MKGKGRSKSKPIKRHDHTGVMVNYGRLEVGVVAGIHCLASKETLLLIGAGISRQKVPEYFYTQHHVNVKFPNQTTLKVYAIRGTDVSSLASRISNRVKLKQAELVAANTGNTTEVWKGGVKIPPEDTDTSVVLTDVLDKVLMTRVSHKTTPKRISLFKRMILLVKRLFSSSTVRN